MAIAELFEQVVLVCHEQGLIGHDLVAIDGCKLASDAAKEWSGTLEELGHKRDKLRKQIDIKLEEHKAIDKLGEQADSNKRSQQVQKTIDTLNRAHDKVVEFLSTAEKRKGQGPRAKEVKSNITDNESCKMTTSKGTIQGYNGIATVDSKHQVIIDAEAIGEGQEHHVFQPVVERIGDRYSRLGISDDIYGDGLTFTADTGYSNKSNVTYLYEHGIESYVPDNQFRQRDPAFQNQKEKHGSPHRKPSKRERVELFSAADFQLDTERRQCQCPAGESLTLRRVGKDKLGNEKLFFQGRLLQCRGCTLKAQCMRRPEAADTRTGHGRQVSFILERSNKETDATIWMKQRVDSFKGKQIYAQRLAVVEPVFGNLRANKGLDRFSLRGKDKVEGQWHLYCLVHNIEKISNNLIKSQG